MTRSGRTTGDVSSGSGAPYSHLREQAEHLPATLPSPRIDSWIRSLRFVVAWILPASLALYLKWFAMTTLGGFARIARSLGLGSLTIADRLSLFRADILLCLVAVPIVLLLAVRFLSLRWSAVLAAIVSGSGLLLFAIQLRALDQIGRYISFPMIRVALGWGMHEAGANVSYISGEGALALIAAVFSLVAVITWAVKMGRRASSARVHQFARIGVEMYILLIGVSLVAGWKSELPRTPYHESSAVRAMVSLWKENSVDTGEFAAFDFERVRGTQVAALPVMSTEDLVTRYRELVHAPLPKRDPRYFGKEEGDNVLFFILETTPDEFLPANDDMKEFPNLARLREKSFVGTRHYTTLPITTGAVFSVFSSWYPADRFMKVWGFGSEQEAPDFLPRLNSLGYQTAAFSPVRYSAEQDQGNYRALGFRQKFVPEQSVATFEVHASWKAERKSADIATLRMLESNLNQWIASDQKFAVAFLPQISHFPYPDDYPPDSSDNMRARARAILALEDSWLGELMDLLQKTGQLDKTIIVVLGDHGRRDRLENPNLARGTVDETAFHVPMLLYAPRTLDHTENIPWITSHIDLAPTVLDLLGIEGGRGSEQGVAIWNPELTQRTTFLLSQPTFGADGYASGGKFYMWNYLSDSVYENSQAVFDLMNLAPRDSAVANNVKSNITELAALEAAWHSHFAQAAKANEKRAFASTVH